MANNQIVISTKPNAAAMALLPREMYKIRNVPRDTSIILAQKISIGSSTQLKKCDSIKLLNFYSLIFLPFAE
jgi:U3 small nucleolar ribonucleoprotein component